MKTVKRILVIAPHYHTFVKGVVDATAKYVSRITVFIPHNYFSDLAPYLPFSCFRHIEMFSKKKIMNLKEKPENVDVNLVSLLYFIPDGRNQILGDKLFEEIDKYIKNNKIEFDLIHAHFTWPCGYAGVKLAEEYEVPVVITIHENRDWFLKEYNSKNQKIYWTWSKADALIRVNKIDVPILINFNKIVYSIPNGYDPNKFRVIERNEARIYLGLHENKKIIFSLGNLIERKGFQYLIEAMKEIVKIKTDVLCFIGGSGIMKKELEKHIRKLGMEDHVKLLGFVSDEELAYWMNAADLFVLPSLSESFGVVQIEAMACGKPIIATYNGGSEEIITSDDYGLLVEPANFEDLAEKIVIALDRKWNSEKIRKFAKQYQWNNVASKQYKLYNLW